MFIKCIQHVYSHQLRNGLLCRNMCSGRRSGSRFPRSDSHPTCCISDLLTQYVEGYTTLHIYIISTCYGRRPAFLKWLANNRSSVLRP